MVDTVTPAAEVTTRRLAGRRVAFAGNAASGVGGQGEFLLLLGIEARADRLKAGRPDAAPVIDRQLERLTADDQMGTLFKVAGVFSPKSLIVPGFEA